MDWCLRVDAPIDLHAFQRAVDRCVAQHSALRTSETPDEALRDTMDKAAALWQLWRAVGRRSDCWERVMASVPWERMVCHLGEVFGGWVWLR